MNEHEVQSLIRQTILTMQHEAEQQRRESCIHQFTLNFAGYAGGGGQYLSCSNGCGRLVYIKYEVDTRA